MEREGKPIFFSSNYSVNYYCSNGEYKNKYTLSDFSPKLVLFFLRFSIGMLKNSVGELVQSKINLTFLPGFWMREKMGERVICAQNRNRRMKEVCT